MQTGNTEYELYLVSPAGDRAILIRNATRILKQLYGKAAQINVIFKKDIAPENSGKYLLSKALFSISLEKYLDKNS